MFFDLFMIFLEHFSFISFNFISFSIPVFKGHLLLNMFVSYVSRFIGSAFVYFIGPNRKTIYFMQSVIYIACILMGGMIKANMYLSILFCRFIQGCAIGAQIPTFALLKLPTPFIIVAVTIAYILAFILSIFIDAHCQFVLFVVTGYLGLVILFLRQKISGINFLIILSVLHVQRNIVVIASVFCVALIVFARKFNRDMHGIKGHLSVIDKELLSQFSYPFIMLCYSFTHSFAQMSIACGESIMSMYVTALACAGVISILMHQGYMRICKYTFYALLILTFINSRFILILGQICITYALNRGIRICVGFNNPIFILIYNTPPIIAWLMIHLIGVSMSVLITWTYIGCCVFIIDQNVLISKRFLK